MPDDLPHRLTAWAARYRRWYMGDYKAALLEEAAGMARQAVRMMVRITSGTPRL